MRLRVQSVILDGEAIYCGPDGLPCFDKVHSRAYDDAVILFAFDYAGTRWRGLAAAATDPTKTTICKADWRRRGAIRYLDHGMGALMFEHACAMNLEGIVSKRRE